MKIINILCLLAALFLGSGCSQLAVHSESLFQHATLDALLLANYTGDYAFSDLAQQGDFGIGTFDALDGEMIAWQGQFYQIKSDSRVYPVTAGMKTPFAVVCFFKPDSTRAVSALPTFRALEENLDALLPTRNIFYAIALEGEFAYVKVRSVPRQEKPYPPLIEIVKTQPVYELKNIQGTLVGFRCPDYVKGVNLPGYHFHFIAKDKQHGGHVLECAIDTATVAIDSLHRVTMDLPKTPEFYQLDLNQDQSKALNKVEK